MPAWATSPTRNGWNWDVANTRLDFGYRGTRIGHVNASGFTIAAGGQTISAGGLSITAGGLTISGGATEIGDDLLFTLGNDNDQAMINRSTILATNTALTGVMIGTPVTPAVAANSLIISNVTASGDILLAANVGGNSQAWLWVDSSAGTMSLYGAGTEIIVNAATYVEVQDNIIFRLGNDGDQAMVNRTTTLAANTALTGVLVGTPVSAETAANSLMISNVTADGDIALFTRNAAGANSIEGIRLDASAGLIVINEASGDVDVRVETDNNANALVIDAGTDSVAIGGAVVSGAALAFNNLTARAAVTSVGNQLHMPTQTQNFSNGSGTLAIGAGVFLGIPTYTGDNATLTFTDAATLYIAGVPVASTNVAITNTALALWVDAGNVLIDDRLGVGGTSPGANTTLHVQRDFTDTADTPRQMVIDGTITHAAINRTRAVLRVLGTFASGGNASTAFAAGIDVGLTLSGTGTQTSAYGVRIVAPSGGTVTNRNSLISQGNTRFGESTAVFASTQPTMATIYDGAGTAPVGAITTCSALYASTTLMRKLIADGTDSAVG